MDVNSTKKAIEGGSFDRAFSLLYPGEEGVQKLRYIEALNAFAELFGDGREVYLFSAPGRTEIGGNHTDHQHGCAMAAAINLDVICVVSKNGDNAVRVYSRGHDRICIDLSDLSPKPDEIDHSAAIVRGIAARCRSLGYNIGGFDAYTVSAVPHGSGLSSSAAFETALGVIISGLFNNDRISAAEIAKMGRFAENAYYGKPCGLMDQMACSVGGLIGMDFIDAENPALTLVDFDFSSCGHSLCVIDTKSGHADLTSEYAAITVEMGNIAAYFGHNVLVDVDENAFYTSISALREKYGDRAVLRSMHFFDETKRPRLLAAALLAGDFEGFKRIVGESGESSFFCLQNAFSGISPEKQGIPLALALSKRRLGGRGVCRVHGGGFAGTIQAFVPDSMLPSYSRYMEDFFGEGSCRILRIRSDGGTRITPSI